MLINESFGLAAVRALPAIFIQDSADDKNLAANRAVEGNIVPPKILKMAGSILFNDSLRHFSFGLPQRLASFAWPAHSEAVRVA